MITADIVDEQIAIVSDLPFRDKPAIMTIPGVTYKEKLNRWVAPLSFGTAVALINTFPGQLGFGAEFLNWYEKDVYERVTPNLEMRLLLGDADTAGDGDLYPFQRIGVKFLATARRAALTDEMGSGKTVQTIRALAELVRRGENPFPAIVVCPNNVKPVWVKEFKRWWPGLKVQLVDGSANQRREQLKDPAHVYIMNWESVRLHSRLAPYGSVRLKRCMVCDPSLRDNPKAKQASCERCKKELNLRPWRTIIADEAHKMKDPKTKQTRAIWALQTKDTEFVYALTGTAVADSPDDMWPALHLVAPKEWPTKATYLDRYCVLKNDPYSGGVQVMGLNPLTKQEFFTILDPRMRRMTKEAILPFLPRKTFVQRFVTMGTKQRVAYRQMEEDLVAMLDGGPIVAVNPLVQMTRLSQFAAAYAELDEEGQVHLAMPSCKIDGMLEVMDELAGRPGVFFSHSRQLIELASVALQHQKVPHGMIVGGMTTDQRVNVIEQFQRGELAAILGTIQAGGIGITLTKADTLCFLQRSWSSIDNAQAEDRVHRIGSEIHDKIQIIDIITENTLEARQRLVLGEKLERLEEVMRDRDLMRRILGA